jgi:hypothetical protein
LGVILTNAHIAQTFLFEDFPSEDFVNCIIRTGSPARSAHKAKLLYLSPDWIEDNQDNLTVEEPTGTGEHDYAFLYIYESLTAAQLPETFPYVELDTSEEPHALGAEFLIGAYPAGLLGGRTIQNDLYAATSITKVAERYTFKETTIDLISLGGSIVAQQGSSGGAVVDERGRMIALISTSSLGGTTADRDLRAITLAHIERSLKARNTSLDQLLEGDLNAKADAFETSAVPGLLQTLLSTFIEN